MRPRSLFALSLICLAAAASAARADDIRVRRGRRGMTRALARAKPGDRLVVRGVVRGDVVVTVPGITIDGDPRGRSRGRFSGSIVVDADGVSIRGVRLKSATLRVSGDDVVIADSDILRSSVYVTGDRASLQRNRVDAGDVQAVATIRGDAAVVEGNEFARFYDGVRVAGGRAIVRDNTFENGHVALSLVGDDAAVSGNVGGSVVLGGDRAALTGNSGGAFVVVGGNGATLSGNTSLGQTTVFGHDATIVANEIRRGIPGLTVYGARMLVTGNSISGDRGGAAVYGDSATIRDNVVSQNSDVGAGITLVGNGATVAGNDVTVFRPFHGGGIGSSAGAEIALRDELAVALRDGISVFGDGNVVAENAVGGQFNGGTALRVQGDANTVDSNTVEDAYRAFAVVMIGDGNSATSNAVSGVDGEGVVVQGEYGVVSDTHVSDVTSCGFLLVGSTVLDGCTATGCTMGIVNLADGSSIVGTTVTGNAPYDLVDLGHAIVSGDGAIGWTTTDPVSFPNFVTMGTDGFVPAPTPEVNVPAWRLDPAGWR